MDFPPRPLRWLFLDLNAYFASVEQQVRPELRGRPVIVAPGGIDTTVAIAASYEAKALGISTGTPVWEARRKCPDIAIVSPRHKLYVEYHDRIVAEIERHIPVTKVCSIDEVACRLLDNENGDGEVRALAARIKAGIHDNVGDWLRCSIGVAPNRLLAKLASDMMKPDGLVILAAEELPQRLYGLKLTDIAGIGPKMARRLSAAGVNDIRQLCERPPLKAGVAWGGTDGDRLWYALHGVDLPAKPTQERTIGHSHVLAPKARGSAAARQTARRLAAKAANRLRRKERATSLLILHVRFDDDRSKWHASIKLAPTQDSFAILTGLETLWPKLLAHAATRGRGEMRLRMVGVTLANLAPVSGQQGSLFERLEPTHELARNLRREALSHALDKITSRFGGDAVLVGAPMGGRADRIGTSIAFGRIPEMGDFGGRNPPAGSPPPRTA